MEQLRGYTVELDLTMRQRTACLMHAGAARYAYNWGLSRKQAAYAAGKKRPSAIDLHRELNALKKTSLPWAYAVSKCAFQEALRDLDNAYHHFFRRVKLKKNGKLKDEKVGLPKKKKRSKAIGSFRLTGTIQVSERSIQLPRLGKLRLKERGYLPQGVPILSATVRERAGRWFVSVRVREACPTPEPATGVPLGVDLGIKTLATCSDGRTFANPKALQSNLQRLKRLHRRVSRKKRGSKNRKKARARVAKQYYRVASIRKDALHQATSALVAKAKPPHARPSVIVLEDLNVAGMQKNHCLAQAMSDVGMGEFRRQVLYKAAQQGIHVQLADLWYPSSKRCSSCDHVKKELSLGERTYVCDACGFTLDRDVNAARNLVALVPTTTASSAEGDACGATVSPDDVRHGVTKQEPNTNRGMSMVG